MRFYRYDTELLKTQATLGKIIIILKNRSFPPTLRKPIGLHMRYAFVPIIFASVALGNLKMLHAQEESVNSSTDTVALETAPANDIFYLTIESYADLALSRSLRSQIVRDTFNSTKWSWLASRRQLTWPQLNATANGTHSLSNDDLGTESKTDSRSASVSFSQPILSGTDLSLSGTWSASDIETDSLGALSDFRTRTTPDISATVTQPLYLFVKNQRWRKWKTNNIQFDTSREFYRQDLLSIEFDARSIYHDLSLFAQTVKVEERHYGLAQSAYKATERLVRAKKASHVDLNRVDLFVRQAYRQIQNAQLTYDQALNEAKDFISMPGDQKVELRFSLDYSPFDVPLETLKKDALQFNPSLRAADNNIHLSEISLQSTKEGKRPRLDLTGTYNRTFDTSDPANEINPYSWTAQVDLNWPLFDATQTKLLTRQNNLVVQNSKRSYENQARQLQVSVENAYLDLKRIEDQIVDFEQQKRSAEKNALDVERAYRRGTARLNDIFDSLDELRKLNLEDLNLLVGFQRAKDRLKTLIGKDPDQL